VQLFDIDELKQATTVVRALVPETPAYSWPLLSRRAGMQVVVKHENRTPIGSFKARGGIVYMELLKQSGTMPRGFVTATRGNHGQSIAIGAARCSIPNRYGKIFAGFTG